MINELGPNDWRFKAIKQEFEKGRHEEVGKVCCNNPSAKWNQVEAALLDASYADMVEFADELHLEASMEDRALQETSRMQKLAGLVKESEEKDYFEHLEELPTEVQDIIDKYADDMHLGYEKAQQLVDELEQEGWTCDYGLDGIPYNLQPLSSMREDMSSEEFEDAKEKEALDAHPEKDKIKAVQDMMANEKPKKEDNSDLSDDFYENEEVDQSVKRMREIAGIKADMPDHEQDGYEGNIVDDFTVGDWVKSKSDPKKGGQVVGTNWRDNSVSVKDPRIGLIKMDANDLMMDPYEDDEKDYEGDWADMKGDLRALGEEEGKVIPFTPTKEKGVSVDDFEDDNNGNLDDYVAKLVAQQMNKGKQIQFTPKK